MPKRDGVVEAGVNVNAGALVVEVGAAVVALAAVAPKRDGVAVPK